MKYPVLYINLKVSLFVSVSRGCADLYQDVQGETFDALLASFDKMIVKMVGKLLNPYNGISDRIFVDWCRSSFDPQNLPNNRDAALEILSTALWTIYDQHVIVLIDEYDSPMHCAINYGYATKVPAFVTIPFFELLTL